ncbi:integrase DNA-binding domain-containing protein [Pseudoramibacter faecis]|uniref:integrase DNA-binding domain-containing protein n=1 Tax=Pseudoramibacter faecis TaxID=3108534 RepID=UPI003CCA2E23
MSVKRRDNKGRILRTGESQRKDGRYVYKYTDVYGKPQFVYAWKLVATDKTPTGKRDGISLREKVKEIRKDLDDGIDTVGKKMTVCQLYAKQNNQRKNVKPNTVKGRAYLMSLLQDDPLGARSIDSVKPSDAKEWAIRMSEKGFSFQSINNFKRSLKASFQMAIEDDCVRKNPFNFALNTVIEDDSKPKQALTLEQADSLIDFIANDPVYQRNVDEIIVLMEAGLRVSELCGLTTALDFTNRLILVDHQLLRDTDLGYYITEPKTKCGSRQVPMTERAYDALQRIVKSHDQNETFTVGGYSNFLFLKRDGTPQVACNVETLVKNIVKKYNKSHKDDPLFNVTPHTFHHTFCTRMANAGMNPKALQYIMGHSNITMTLNYYAHADFDSAKAEMERLEQKPVQIAEQKEALAA